LRVHLFDFFLVKREKREAIVPTTEIGNDILVFGGEFVLSIFEKVRLDECREFSPILFIYFFKGKCFYVLEIRILVGRGESGLDNSRRSKVVDYIVFVEYWL
jgi:hypothetical protein